MYACLLSFNHIILDLKEMKTVCVVNMNSSYSCMYPSCIVICVYSCLVATTLL